MLGKLLFLGSATFVGGMVFLKVGETPNTTYAGSQRPRVDNSNHCLLRN